MCFTIFMCCYDVGYLYYTWLKIQTYGKRSLQVKSPALLVAKILTLFQIRYCLEHVWMYLRA